MENADEKCACGWLETSSVCGRENEYLPNEEKDQHKRQEEYNRTECIDDGFFN